MFNRAHFLYKYHRKCNVIKETDDTTKLKINYYTLINKAVASNLIWAPGISFQAWHYQIRPVFTNGVEICQTPTVPWLCKTELCLPEAWRTGWIAALRTRARALQIRSPAEVNVY